MEQLLCRHCSRIGTAQDHVANSSTHYCVSPCVRMVSQLHHLYVSGGILNKNHAFKQLPLLSAAYAALVDIKGQLLQANVYRHVSSMKKEQQQR